MGVVKIYRKTSSVAILHSGVSCETIAIRLLYTDTANLAWLKCSTGKPQLIQYFKMVFLKINTECGIKNDFRKSSHISCCGQVHGYSITNAICS